MKKIIILMLLLFNITQTYSSEDAVICSMDAKQCSNVSWIGRTGPSCEFVCPKRLQKPKTCTKEYIPVCAEVQVQCIKAPCLPIKETFSNKCEMENNSLAKFLHEWPCEESENIKEKEDITICSTIYKPVCGNDGHTYKNACLAQTIWIKYNGICISSKYEKAVYKAWQEAFLKHFSKTSEDIIAQKLEKIIENAERLASKENSESQKWAVLNYILYLAKKMLHENIYEKYIKKNISTLSPVRPVLWGKWHVTKITWLDTNTAIVECEDWHIMESMKINISAKSGKLKVTNLEKRLEVKTKFDGKDMVIKLKIPINWEWKYTYKFITPWNLQFSFPSKEKWKVILFNINIHTDTDWKKQEANSFLNLTKIMNRWGYVVSYSSNVLDMPFIKDENINTYNSILEDMYEIIKTINLIIK